MLTRSEEEGLPLASLSFPLKITPPRAACLFPRTRLFELLDGSRERHAVIWVSGPAGAGKTSLATSYLGVRKLPALWYQVDAGDDDIASFFYYLGLAAQRLTPQRLEPLPVFTPEYLGQVDAFARNYFRELYRWLPERSLVVLDNYQDAPQDSQLHEVLLIAMQEIPNIHNLLILSRTESPPAIARLRLSQHATFIGWDKIRFTFKESVGISEMRLGRKRLSDDVQRQLYEQSQGWAAGLVLMLEQGEGDSNQRLSEAPSDRGLLFDYFASEIFSRVLPKTRAFLLKTALFPKITVEAAAELTGHEKAQDLLEDLARRNFFTVRHADATQYSYEYHPLFREFLLARLSAETSKNERRRLERRAAMLLLDGGLADDAANLFITAEAWGDLIPLAVKYAAEMVCQGRSRALARWIETIPKEIREASPWLEYWLGVCRLPFGATESREVLERAFARFTEIGDLSGRYLAWCAIVDTFVFEWNDFTPLDYWLSEAERLQSCPPPSEEIAVRFAGAMFMALMNRRPQRLLMAPWEEKVLQIVLHNPNLELRTIFGNHLILYKTWMTGDLTTAETVLRTLRPLVEAPGISALAKITFGAMAGAYDWASGNGATCLSSVEAALALGQESGVHLWDGLLCSQALFALMTTDRWKEAQTYLTRLEALLPRARPFERMMFHYFHGWYALQHGTLDVAARHGQAATEMGQIAGSPYAHANMQLEWSRALFHLGEPHRAKELLMRTGETGQIIESRTLDYQIALLQAEFALVEGRENDCVDALRRMLPIGRACTLLAHGWWRTELMVRLYALALEHDIELDYVCTVIRQRKLLPPAGMSVTDKWPWNLKIYTLGRFALVKDGQPLKFEGKVQKKPLALLKVLVAFGGRGVSETKIVEQLWPEADGDVAHANLKPTLHRLRKLVGQDVLLWQDGRLTLNPDQCWVDAWAFERLASQLSASSMPSIAEAERLMSSYRGAFLDGEEEVFAFMARERLRTKFLDQAQNYGKRLNNACAYSDAIIIYNKILEREPLIEAAYQGLIHAHKALNQPAEALRVYARCCLLLQTQLQLDPSPDTLALIQGLSS